MHRGGGARCLPGSGGFVPRGFGARVGFAVWEVAGVSRKCRLTEGPLGRRPHRGPRCTNGLRGKCLKESNP